MQASTHWLLISEGFLSLKVMVSSWESNAENIKKLDSKVLGVGWNQISKKLNFNFGVSIVYHNQR